MSSELTVNVAEALTIEPGDRVLVTMGGYPTPAQVVHTERTLAERFPDAEFTILLGVEKIAVQRPTESEWSPAQHGPDDEYDPDCTCPTCLE